MSYFFPGLWHFAAALSFAAALGELGNGDALFLLRQPAFAAMLLLGSSALFFVPDAWAKKGLLKFLHYPLPDWDVLLLGPASHRNWFTHSPVLPILCCALAWRFPVMLNPLFAQAAAGLAVGVGSHLFWDCVGSRSHSIVVVPYWKTMRAATSRLWLLAGAAICLGIAARFGVLPALTPFFDKFPDISQITVQAEKPNATRAALAPIPMNNFPQPVLVARGVTFPEGPSLAWNDQLLCVDVLTSRIVSIDRNKTDGQAETWLETTLGETKGKPNGSKFHNGVLYVCDAARKQMLAISATKKVRVIADAARGDLANGPNDCAFDARGDFFFTDPNYDKKTASVYLSRGSKSTVEIDRTWKTEEFAVGFDFPNGVAIGPDGAVYVAETNRNRIWRIARKPDGSAGERAVWCDLPTGEAGRFFGPDGIAFDAKGRLFVAHFGLGKIEVVAADGKGVVARLDAGGNNPTNLCFSPDGKTLYITETQSKAIYSLDISGI